MRLNDVFWTIQGEGYNAGTRALFVRLPFCNLRCSWCDTSYNTFTEWSDEQLGQVALQEKSLFAVITGGEPSMNKDCPKVARLLKGLGFRIAMESNGTFDPCDEIDWVTISPKREAGYLVTEEAFNRASEFKLVVDSGFDFSILKPFEAHPEAFLYLSPEFTDMESNVEKIIAYIKENPRWKISLQTHKWMNIK